MKKFILIFIGLTNCVLTSFRPTPTIDTHQTIPAVDKRLTQNHLELTYKDLADLMNIIQLTVDNDEKYSCSLLPDQRVALSQMLKNKIDERYAVDMKNYLKMSSKERFEFFPKECLLDCSCFIYSYFFDFLKQHRVLLTKTEKIIAYKIASSSHKQSTMTHACGNTQGWVCTSRIFQSLLISNEL